LEYGVVKWAWNNGRKARGQDQIVSKTGY